MVLQLKQMTFIPPHVPFEKFQKFIYIISVHSEELNILGSNHTKGHTTNSLLWLCGDNCGVLLARYHLLTHKTVHIILKPLFYL